MDKLKQKITNIGNKKIFKFFLVVFLFLFLSIIRLHGYDRVPGPSHAEELLFGWSGIYLIEEGYPVSWSALDYPKENIFFEGIVGDKDNIYLPARLYKPFLDEPPLYSLIVGSISHFYNDNKQMVLPTSHTRIPTVVSSLVVMFMVFLVSKQFFGYWVGVLSMIFYGASPIFVFGSRLSVPENMFALWVIVSLYLADQYLKNPKIGIAVFWGISSVILGLMKPTGFFLAFLAIFLCLKAKKKSHCLVILFFTLIGILLFLYYGYFFGGELFWHILKIQGIRFAGWTGLGSLLTQPAFDIFITYDGWYIFSLFFAVSFCLKKNMTKEMSLLSLFFFFWLMVAVFSGTEQDLLPWYRYSFFPLLAIFGGLGLKSIFDDPDFFGVAFVAGLLLSGRFLVHNEFRPTTPPNVFRVLYLIFLIPSLLSVVYKKKFLVYLSKGIIIFIFVCGFFFNSKYIYSAFEVSCESKSCPFGKSTKISEIKIPFFWRFFVLGDSTGMLKEKRPIF